MQPDLLLAELNIGIAGGGGSLTVTGRKDLCPWGLRVKRNSLKFSLACGLGEVVIRTCQAAIATTLTN